LETLNKLILIIYADVKAELLIIPPIVSLQTPKVIIKTDTLIYACYF